MWNDLDTELKSLPQVAPNSMEADITAWEMSSKLTFFPLTFEQFLCLKKKPLLSSQHAMCSTSTRWRWSPWQALRPLPRPSLRPWRPLPHLLPLSCTSRCRHKASHWQTTRESKSTYEQVRKRASKRIISNRTRFDSPYCSEYQCEYVVTQNYSCNNLPMFKCIIISVFRLKSLKSAILHPFF